VKVRVPPVGQRYGRLIVVAQSETNVSVSDSRPSGFRAVIVRCDCGSEFVVACASLLQGNTQSCGCLGKDILRKRSKTHGQSSTAEYTAWCGMKDRCYNPKHEKFKYYGGRGISVWGGWQDNFSAFLSHIGPKPSPSLSLDRINNNGNYEPGNVRWADQTTQVRNSRRWAR
jgi:hypothetical protein